MQSRDPISDVGGDAFVRAKRYDYRLTAASWLYSRALCSFRREGDSRRSRRRLREALDANLYVPEYLLGERRLPRRLPDAVGIGDRDEAVSYAAEAMAVWRWSGLRRLGRRRSRKRRRCTWARRLQLAGSGAGDSQQASVQRFWGGQGALWSYRGTEDRCPTSQCISVSHVPRPGR